MQNDKIDFSITIQQHSDTLILFLSLMGNTNVCCPIPMTFPWTSLRITPSGYTLY